jgi:uncharacterized protein YecT (DUF1311 family)
MATGRLGLGMAALAAAAWPAIAQDPPFSPEATETCLARAPERAGCIGFAADDCMRAPDGQTTVGMSYCYEREYAYWDARLNAAYAALADLEEAADAEMREIGAAAPSTAEALRAMQRAWIPYRDAACDYERSEWGGGTGGGPATAACLMRLTGEQALALEDRLERRRGQ